MLFSEIGRFIGEIRTKNFTVSNNENYDFRIFIVWDSFFPVEYPMNSESRFKT